jgi:predicted Zn-dependent protease
VENHPYLEQTQQLRDGDRDGARRIVEQATKQGNVSADDLHALALVMDEKRLREASTQLLEEVLRREPTAVESACVLAMFHLENQEDPEAADVLRPVLAASPDHPRANLVMAMALSKTESIKARTHAAKAKKDTDPDVRAQAEALDQILAEHSPR